MSDQLDHSEGPDTIRHLAERYLGALRRAQEHKKAEQEASKEADQLERLIIEKADESGIDRFSIPNGPMLTVRRGIKAWVLAADREKANDWLRQRGYSHVIQPNFTSLQPVVKELMEHGVEIPDFIKVEGVAKLPRPRSGY